MTFIRSCNIVNYSYVHSRIPKFFYCSFQETDLIARYGKGLMSELQREASKCTVTIGSRLTLVALGSSEEYCVKLDPPNCSCSGFGRAGICFHFIAAVKDKSAQYINSILPKTVRSKTQLISAPNAGSKPGERGRKGGRNEKVTPAKAYSNIIQGEYIVIRKSRQKVCNGCKGPLEGDKFTIRHHCALPYPFKDPITGAVHQKIGAPNNHHFHLSNICITRSPYHKQFDGRVVLDGAVTLTNNLRDLIKTGDLRVGRNY